MNFYLTQLLRIILISTFVGLVDFIFALGVPLVAQVITISAGVFVAGQLTRRYASFWRIVGVQVLIFILGYYFLIGVNSLVLLGKNVDASRDFAVTFILDQLSLLCFLYSVSFLTTWFYWTKREATFIEAIIANFAIIGLLAGHRNYQIDAPKQISSLTWKYDLIQTYHLEPQQIFIGIGGMCALVALLYFYLSATRPIFSRERIIITKYRGSAIEAIITALAFVLVTFLFGQRVNSSYLQNISRASEGVGQSAKAGESSLGFHSATGNSNQPMALVRMEKDYIANPWAPMLYFREGSLSLYNGREMVISDPTFDTDVPRSSPSEPFIGVKTDPGNFREKLSYSVFQLVQHKTPPAIDLPIRIGAANNPDPKSFISVYKAVSMVPTIKVEDLAAEQVGDPTWNHEILNHYLRAPGSRSLEDDFEIADMLQPQLDKYGEDLRYLALTRKIVGDRINPIERAVAIVRYLSENSTYTHKPGHNVTADGDPVAPYLFSKDMRGYCVHFSHAGTYLLRLAGIPARVGTGYLTDLTYSKDGHILLQMGDRHAWPEIYVNGLGWAVLDIQPAKAENEQAPIPDSQILEKLMGKLDTLPELEEIPAMPNSDENQYFLFEFFGEIPFTKIIILLAALLLLTKLWLRFGYLVAGNENTRIRRLYIAMASTYLDTGTPRQFGETRNEYLQRLEVKGAYDLTSLSRSLGASVYGNLQNVGKKSVDSIESEVKHAISRIHPLRRFFGFFSPLSVARWKRW
jgi:hypothetical protein